MNRAPLIVAGEAFATKAALTERCRAILWAYRPGESLSREHVAFIADLARRHPEASEKIGTGIGGVSIRKDAWGKQCFWIHHTDGSEVDFSFVACISPPSRSHDFRTACRGAVKHQIIAFKQAAFAAAEVLPCPITGKAMSFATSHVDHAPPNTFAALCDRFLSESGLRVADVSCYERGGMEWTFSDEIFLAAWQAFHLRHARLRVVSVEANLSVIGRGLR